MKHITKTPAPALPGIVRIGRVAPETLPKNLPLRAVCGMQVHVLASRVDWIAVSSARWELAVKREEGRRSEELELTFATTAPLPGGDAGPHAFVIEDAAGEAWVVGAKERSYPQVSLTRTSGEATGRTESAERTYKVMHKAVRCMAPAVLQG